MTEPSGVMFCVQVMPGYGPAQARNKIAESAIASHYDFILYVDSDQIVPSNTLVKLLDCKSMVAAGWSMMALGDKRTNISRFNTERNFYDFFNADQMPEGVVQVDAIGFSAVLVDVAVFDKISYPYFDYVEFPNKTSLSEDLYFCDQLRKCGIPIHCDTSLRISHIKQVFI
jgi:GT2 family glycosyltransferase